MEGRSPVPSPATIQGPQLPGQERLPKMHGTWLWGRLLAINKQSPTSNLLALVLGGRRLSRAVKGRYEHPLQDPPLWQTTTCKTPWHFHAKKIIGCWMLFCGRKLQKKKKSTRLAHIVVWDVGLGVLALFSFDFPVVWSASLLQDQNE